MFAGERREAILDSLIKNRKVNVLELSKEFAVSQVIIRKDLKLLEAEGKLQRTHGGAIEKRKVALNTTFEDRKIINEEEKMVIAKKAYELINDNDVILMDISTINFMIARLLEEKPKRITIITQSLDLIVVLSSINEINIISLGGSFDKKNRAFLGRITSSNIKSGLSSNATFNPISPSVASRVLYPSFFKLYTSTSIIACSSSTISTFFAPFSKFSSTKIPPFRSFIFI